MYPEFPVICVAAPFSAGYSSSGSLPLREYQMSYSSTQVSAIIVLKRSELRLIDSELNSVLTISAKALWQPFTPMLPHKTFVFGSCLDLGLTSATADQKFFKTFTQTSVLDC